MPIWLIFCDIEPYWRLVRQGGYHPLLSFSIPTHTNQKLARPSKTFPDNMSTAPHPKNQKNASKTYCNGETCLEILMAGDRAFTGACATAEAVVV